MEATLFLLVFIVLGIAALRWGATSRETLASLEWQRCAPYWHQHTEA